MAQRKRGEEARNRLRHGRAVAAIVPVERAAGAPRQKSLLGVAGTGKRLWGKDSARTLRRFRGEWKR